MTSYAGKPSKSNAMMGHSQIDIFDQQLYLGIFEITEESGLNY